MNHKLGFTQQMCWNVAAWFVFAILLLVLGFHRFCGFTKSHTKCCDLSCSFYQPYFLSFELNSIILVPVQVWGGLYYKSGNRTGSIIKPDNLSLCGYQLIVCSVCYSGGELARNLSLTLELSCCCTFLVAITLSLSLFIAPSLPVGLSLYLSLSPSCLFLALTLFLLLFFLSHSHQHTNKHTLTHA